MVVQNKVDFFVNVFPSTSHDWKNIKFEVDGKMIYVRHLFEFHSSMTITTKPKYWCFRTNKIFINCCQSEIYAVVTDQIIEKTLLGVDTVILGYGQNHSGKTYTITGLQNQFNLRGIVPRFVSDLMKQKKIREEDFITEIWISIVDIFKDALYDLLKKNRPKCKDEKEVRNVKVRSEFHCLELLFKAEAARMTVEEKTYPAHSATNIVTFTVKTIPLNNQDTLNKVSKVHFVDLAGVETIDRSPVTSIKDKVTQGDANVTKSLLEIFALQSHSKRNNERADFSINKSRTHVVTKYLGDSLSSVSNLKLICHIRPNREDLGITLSLLRFGMSFLNITMLKLRSNIEVNEEQEVKNLKEELQALKDDILVKQMCESVGKIDISQDRIDFIKRSITLYLNNEISEQELLSLVDDCSLILKLIKDMSKENIPKNNLSVGLQTDVLDEFKTLQTEEQVNSIEEINEKKVSQQSESKNLSVQGDKPKKGTKEKTSKQKKEGKSGTKSKKSDKTVSGKKGKKVAEKTELKEAEVQVNLVEPKAKLPNLDSREGLWALFLTRNPEVQVLIDKINLLISRKEKTYNEEVAKYETTVRSLNKVQLELNKLATIRHSELTEIYNDDGHIVISEEESKLAKQLLELKAESLITKQQLTDAQTDWLDSLEKMNCEKQLVEIKFKEFCVQNHLLAITEELAAQQNVPEKLTPFPHMYTSQTGPLYHTKSPLRELTDLGPQPLGIDEFEYIYVVLRIKYLKK